MTDLNQILNLMTAFQSGTLTASAFSEQYTKLWNELVDEQDAAIERDATVSQTIKELREMNQNGEITPDRYSQRVQEQYALLQGIAIRPGSKVAEILDQLFVVVDAYREDEDEADSFSKTADELHETVVAALKDLEA